MPMLSIPVSRTQSIASPKAIAYTIGGVPASNLKGGSAKVDFSILTTSIISPPPKKGGIYSNILYLPNSMPIPVGPYNL